MLVEAQRWDRQDEDHDPPTFEDPSALPAVTAAVHPLEVTRGETVERTVEGSSGEHVTTVDTVVRALRPAV